MDEKIIEINEKARKILEDIQIDTSIGESRIITMLQKIEQQDIEKSEIDIIEKTLNNIENYLFTKQKMQVEINDYEYLKNIAETLRNQKVRIEDNVILGQPVFRIMVGEEEVIYFITREGARKFIETHSTIFDKNIDSKKQEKQVERRKDELMEVTTNKNLEISKILEIIKRNY